MFNTFHEFCCILFYFKRGQPLSRTYSLMIKSEIAFRKKVFKKGYAYITYMPFLFQMRFIQTLLLTS